MADGGNKGKKSGNRKKEKDQFNIDDYKIPEIELKYLNSMMNQPLTDLVKYEHTFRFNGTFYLSGYVPSEKSSLKQVIEVLKKDVDI